MSPRDDTPKESVPRFVPREDTGKVSERFASTVAPGGEFDDLARATTPDTLEMRAPRSQDFNREENTPLPRPPTMTSVSPADFLDEVAHRLARRVPTPPPPPPPPRRYLGLSAGDWTKMLIGWAVAAALFLGTWWLSVRDALRDRPTHDTVEKTLKAAVEDHSAGIHPKTAQEIEVLEIRTQDIRESQVRQEQVDKAQTETLREIRSDVKELRRRSRP